MAGVDSATGNSIVLQPARIFVAFTAVRGSRRTLSFCSSATQLVYEL